MLGEKWAALPIQFFESIDKRDVDLLLATLVFNAKRGPSAPGGFSWAEWIDGREKSRKYQAKVGACGGWPPTAATPAPARRLC